MQENAALLNDMAKRYPGATCPGCGTAVSERICPECGIDLSDPDIVSCKRCHELYFYSRREENCRKCGALDPKYENICSFRYDARRHGEAHGTHCIISTFANIVSFGYRGLSFSDPNKRIKFSCNFRSVVFEEILNTARDGGLIRELVAQTPEDRDDRDGVKRTLTVDFDGIMTEKLVAYASAETTDLLIRRLLSIAAKAESMQPESMETTLISEEERKKAAESPKPVYTAQPEQRRETVCPKCGRVSSKKFCGDCGTRLIAENETVCASCGMIVEKTKFCSECGAELK